MGKGQDLSKSIKYAIDYFKVAQFMDAYIILDWAKKFLEKGENAGYQNFVHFPSCFPNYSLSRLLKFRIVCNKSYV